ncbi:MAG: SiaB family protein kinase [Defluviitaleaceae bacterium]|nr:SiaB family protein kinase [Defluviitaleaceae bacterium]MCL2835434.1 SiaB family protein kinase [Defluviitaleaceae bacterium]
MFDMMEYHKTLRDHKVTLVYTGPLWAEGIGGVATTLKKRLEYDNLPLETSQEVFSVFVEQMNNMLMYSKESELFTAPDDLHSAAPKGTFILGTLGKAYYIHTGNIMKNDSAELIKNRIDHLNTLDKKELRKFFKEQTRLEDDNPDSKGAGLGFIEIARRISSKIEYDFKPYEDGYTFFTMYVTIGGGAE